MTLRCALYARYSSDQQRAVSIEDQFRICREHAEREGWRIENTYRDAAISGASVILRPGVQALLEGARGGRFEVVVAEALDRVSRDQADVAILYKHLCFAGVKLVTLAEGEVNELHVGLKGTMNALFLKDLAAKTHRGIAAGMSPRAIARRLNAKGVPSPRRGSCGRTLPSGAMRSGERVCSTTTSTSAVWCGTVSAS